MALPDVAPPNVIRHFHDLCYDRQPTHSALDLVGYMDSDWATCLMTCHLMGGAVGFIAGGNVAYNIHFIATVAQSSNEAEFVEADIADKLYLFCRSCGI